MLHELSIVGSYTQEVSTRIHRLAVVMPEILARQLGQIILHQILPAHRWLPIDWFPSSTRKKLSEINKGCQLDKNERSLV